MTRFRTARDARVENLRTSICRLARSAPELTYAEIGRRHGVSGATAQRYASDGGVKRVSGPSKYRQLLRMSKREDRKVCYKPTGNVKRSLEYVRTLAEEEGGRDKYLIEHQRGYIWIVWIGEQPDVADRRQGEVTAA